ncbi:MAG: hypothetical protein KJ964_11015 [Verrucomicrobia bacterium]|nr:hypothetical protein [Verrucomicrobiota bacterium]MBU1734145.1 hypothetical protein [Verrucomicrobiota bacterium]MBU1855395.1 hypothetical protein [Verrucomicrobiota bacterium]
MEEVPKSDYVYWCSNLIHYGIGMGSTSMMAIDIGNTGFETNEKLAFFRQQATTTIAHYYLHEKMLWLNPDSLNMAPPSHHYILKQVAPDVYCLPIAAKLAKTRWNAIFTK